MNKKRVSLRITAVLALLLLALPIASAFAHRISPKTDLDHIVATNLTALSGDITEEEANGLIFMREEEKLARDVYLTLYDIWGTAIFSNIASSEQTHMDSILTLLDRYGLDDPVADNSIGVFTNPYLQALYSELIAIGSQSLTDALTVGATIEEIDIIDLNEYIDATTNPAILRVYGNLVAGSKNHLRAFVSQLEQITGETYVPQYLSQEEYDAIISEGSNGQGGNGQGGNGRGGNGQGGNRSDKEGALPPPPSP